jgi:hypothetical protein
MRGFDIYIPSDYSGARSEKEHTQAVAQLEAAVNLMPSSSLRLPNVIHAGQIFDFA